MQIEYVNSKNGYYQFSKYLILKHIKSNAAIHLVFVFFLTGLCAGNSWNWLRIAVLLVPVTVIYLVFIYFLPLWITREKFRKRSRNDSSAFEKKSMTVVEDGLLIDSRSKSTLWRWEALTQIGANSDFIYLFLADKRYLLFPKRSFESISEAVAFMGMVQGKINRLSQSQFQILKQKSRSPYLLGLICVIPLVGAILGLALIILGISKYKDKWLVIIGAAGIIWTVWVYGSMQYSLRHSDASKKVLRAFAQTDLNALLRDVEFYKIEHGSYPDSLAQAVENDQMTQIVDPTQSFFRDKKVYFNYHKAGGHYYLFSSGADGIPGTKDDVYPQIAPSDSAKFGWINGEIVR